MNPGPDTLQETRAPDQKEAAPPALAQLWPPFRAEWILYEDEDLIVVNKPAGIPTHAPERDRNDDVKTRLSEWLRARDKREPYLGIHQRLDRDTSGVLLFTRRREANPEMARQFEGRLVQKSYVGCAELNDMGFAKRGEAVLRHRLLPDKDGLMQARPEHSQKGQLAITRVRVQKRNGKRAMLEIRPETGRTHQIRVQLAALQMPLAGDTAYPGPKAARLLLHASELRIQHPTTGKAISFRAPPPDCFEQWLNDNSKGLIKNSIDFDRLLREAAEKRYGIAKLPKTNAFRLLNGAGDDLPGFTIDVYGDYLVVSLTDESAQPMLDAVLDAAHGLGARGVYKKIRPKHASIIVDSRRDEFAPSHAVRGESAPESFQIQEHGLFYEVRLGDGLSTGIFLDQRENRRRVREFSENKRVLNCFAYTGAFSVAAAAGGARETLSVDISQRSLAWARRNLDAIHANPAQHKIIEADVFGWMKFAAREHEQFDLIILDPPSFSTTKTTRFSAESDYRSLATLAIGLLGENGRLLASTNHRGIVRAKFRRFLHEAARASKRALVQMKDMPDPIDFPPEPGFEPAMKSVLITF